MGRELERKGKEKPEALRKMQLKGLLTAVNYKYRNKFCDLCAREWIIKNYRKCTKKKKKKKKKQKIKKKKKKKKKKKNNKNPNKKKKTKQTKNHKNRKQENKKKKLQIT